MSRPIPIPIFLLLLIISSFPFTLAGLLDFFSFSLFSPPDISHSTALEVIQRTSCWHRPEVRELIEEHCLKPTLSDEGRYRLAIALTNCHLSASDLTEIRCTTYMSVERCTKSIPEIPMAFPTYTAFFTHIDSLCFYMKKDNFHQSTTDAINALAFATIRSKETLADFSKDMLDNQHKLNQHFAEHQIEEDNRFKNLISGLSNAQTLLQYIGTGQEALSKQGDQIMNKTDEINSKQFETLTQLGLFSNQLTEFEKEERIRYETTLGRMIIVEKEMKQQTQTFNMTYTHLTTKVLQTHTHLNSLSSQLAADLAQTRGQLSALISDVFYAIQNLHIELISFTSLLFYPAMFIVIFLMTSTSRAYNSRMWLYTLLGMVFLLERSLAKGTTWALYSAHFIMCSMRYSHALFIHILLKSIQFIFGGRPSVDSMLIEKVIIHNSSIGSVLQNTQLLDEISLQATISPLQHILQCPSCIITQHTIITILTSTFTIAAENEVLIEMKHDLGQDLPIISLKADEYIAMIEVIRIAFLFLSAVIWSMTILTYRDPIQRVEERVDKVMVQLSLLESSLASFKEKMVLFTNALREGSTSVAKASYDSFSTLFLGAKRDQSSDNNHQSPPLIMNNRTDVDVLIPRSPREARMTPIASNVQNSPMVLKSVEAGHLRRQSQSRGQKGGRNNNNDDNNESNASSPMNSLLSLHHDIDPDGDTVYIPSSPQSMKPLVAKRTRKPATTTTTTTTTTETAQAQPQTPTKRATNTRTSKTTTIESPDDDDGNDDDDDDEETPTRATRSTRSTTKSTQNSKQKETSTASASASASASTAGSTAGSTPTRGGSHTRRTTSTIEPDSSFGKEPEEILPAPGRRTRGERERIYY